MYWFDHEKIKRDIKRFDFDIQKLLYSRKKGFTNEFIDNEDICKRFVIVYYLTPEGNEQRKQNMPIMSIDHRLFEELILEMNRIKTELLHSN